MLKFDEICELIRLIGSTQIASVEIEHAGSRVRIEGRAAAAVSSGSGAETASVPVAGPLVEVPPVRRADPSDGAADPADEDGLHYVTSPIVGTFYRAPNPDADPYVKVGDLVDKGQVLCIVEAMKLMNEIECDAEGTIVKVFPDNAEAVEFGQRLFAVKMS